jgi:hypothetical protein
MTTQEKSKQGFWQSLFGRDEGHVTSDESHHTIEVVMHLEGDDDAN